MPSKFLQSQALRATAAVANCAGSLTVLLDCPPGAAPPGALHAAAADLAPSALEPWRADPRATDWWEQARQLLAASAPVAPQTLIELPHGRNRPSPRAPSA